MKRFCQACKREIPIDAHRCIHCGSLQSSSGISIRKQDSAGSLKRTLMIVLCGLLGGGIVIGLYWYFKVNPRLQGLGVLAPDSKTIRKTIDVENDSAENFDKKVSLPAEPMGFAFGKGEYILGNRKDPWGFIRMIPAEDEDSFELMTVPVHETNYMQRMSFNAVAWNGTQYISVTDGAWFNSASKNVFCKHDPASLKILSTVPAPDQLGCLAFDGSGYWAATRSNTLDSGEPVFLYRMDADLREISRHEAPAKGCQGLAWDGQFLWFVDVFNDSIYVLDIAGEQPVGVHRIPTNFSYLSGIAFDGRNIWVSEYEKHQIHRLSPDAKRRVATLSGQPALTTTIVDSTDSEQRLKDSYENRSPEYPEEDADVHEFSAEISSGVIYVSWKIYFGEKLFASEPPADSAFSMPLFARYTVSASGPGLGETVQQTFDAEPGMNEKVNLQLTQITEPGDYNISLFIYVQYIRPDGGNQILNQSASPLTVRY